MNLVVTDKVFRSLLTFWVLKMSFYLRYSVKRTIIEIIILYNLSNLLWSTFYKTLLVNNIHCNDFKSRENKETWSSTLSPTGVYGRSWDPSHLLEFRKTERSRLRKKRRTYLRFPCRDLTTEGVVYNSSVPRYL